MDRKTHVLALFVFAPLVLGAGAVHAQSAEILAPAALPQMSDACALTLERCTVDCLGRDQRDAMVSCLLGCDNAAALCSRDPQPTLSSEWYAERFGNGIATKAGACHDTTPCPSEYASCGSWSGWSSCGDTYCSIWRYCGGPCPGPTCFGDATRQETERFRVCFNSSGASCTEWERSFTVLGCGC